MPRPIRSELHVGSLKKSKHAIHDELLGTLLITRIQIIVFNSNNYLCSLYSAGILLLGIGFPCTKSTLYTVIYHTKFVGICHGG